MRCPACRQPITETEASCRQCGFSLEALAAQMGIAPQLTRPVADIGGVLSASEQRSMARAVQLLEQRFPDIFGVVVISEIPAHLTPELYAFWLFNRTSLFSEVEKGGSNHGVLLLLDAQSTRAAVMIGYGLEPLVPETIRFVVHWQASATGDHEAYWREQLLAQLTAPADRERLGPAISKLAAALGGGTHGAELLVDYHPERGMRIGRSGQAPQAFAGLELARLVLGLWIGPEIRSDVRAPLLAGLDPKS